MDWRRWKDSWPHAAHSRFIATGGLGGRWHVQEMGSGPEIMLLHGAGGIARQITRLVEGQTFDRTAGRRAVMTGDPDDFQQLAKVLSTYGIDQIEQF